ncbi:MAG: hypothetical protein M5U26_02550 [Planctomycetota bacterium]|nr:hypothetical protein [Planctomycetota bacterium]
MKPIAVSSLPESKATGFRCVPWFGWLACALVLALAPLRAIAVLDFIAGDIQTTWQALAWSLLSQGGFWSFCVHYAFAGFWAALLVLVLTAAVSHGLARPMRRFSLASALALACVAGAWLCPPLVWWSEPGFYLGERYWSFSALSIFSPELFYAYFGLGILAALVGVFLIERWYASRVRVPAPDGRS